MNVLVLTPSWPSPPELWLHRMIEMLEESTVAIATFAPAEPKWRGKIPAVDLLPGFSKTARKLRLTAVVPGLGNRHLQNALVKYKADAVFCHYANCALSFQSVWDRTSIPLFVHCHGFDITWGYRLPHFPYVRIFGERYKESVIRLSERATLIANSEFTRRRLEKAGVSRGRIVTKYLGVPVASEGPVRHPSLSLRILYLGRLIDFKGPDLTIRAFDAACKRGLNGFLTVAGTGAAIKECVRLARRSQFSERIQFPGLVNEEQGATLRSESHVFTAHNRMGPHTGQEEAYGVSVVEAMAAGLPVVTGRSGGVCETVIDGETGILFEPGDVEAHAAALISLANDSGLRSRMGYAGWQRARERFSLEREAEQLRAMFEMSK